MQAICWSVLLFVPAQPPEVKTDLANNAALQYWKAFALMPTLDKEQEKIVKDWNTVPIDAAVLKLLDSCHSSLQCLHRAAKVERCDWGLDYDDGVSMLIPHLNKSRDLARLAALHARSMFEQGNLKAARDDTMSIMTLARHTGRDPVMISVLVRHLIEGLVVDVVAPHVPELKASYEQSLAMFKALPSAPNVLQTIIPEKKFFMEWMIRKLKDEEAKKKGAGLTLWKQLIEGSEIPETLKNKSVEDIIKLMEVLGPVYDELARLVALPAAEFDAQYPAFKKKTSEANPAASVFLPAVDQLMAKERRNEARFAMLLAGIAVVESGVDKLKEIKDPFGAGPFEYRALDKGFELKSKLQFEGKPVTLVIGKGKAE